MPGREIVFEQSVGVLNIDEETASGDSRVSTRRLVVGIETGRYNKLDRRLNTSQSSTAGCRQSAYAQRRKTVTRRLVLTCVA